jgi:hypothetical protein
MTSFWEHGGYLLVFGGYMILLAIAWEIVPSIADWIDSKLRGENAKLRSELDRLRLQTKERQEQIDSIPKG